MLSLVRVSFELRVYTEYFSNLWIQQSYTCWVFARGQATQISTLSRHDGFGGLKRIIVRFLRGDQGRSGRWNLPCEA
jgi:hypothetical protein